MARRGLTKQQKKRLKEAATWGGLALLGWETFQAMIVRRQRRRDSYQGALNRSAATSKPIAVLGAPKGRWLASVLGADHECADAMCIDPRGCGSCEFQTIAAFTEGLRELPDSSHVVYVDTGVFERSENPAELANQIMRVSGGDIYMAPLGRWTLFAYLPPNRQRVTAAPPEDAILEWRGWSGDPQRIPVAELRLNGTRRGPFRVIQGG